jgi:hypothetical protein
MPQVAAVSTKKSTELNLIDKLSRLWYQQTPKLLGSDAAKLLGAGDKWDFRIEEDIYLAPDLFRLKFSVTAGDDESARPIVPLVFGRKPQGAALFRMGYNARPDRASPEETSPPLCST